MDRVAKPARNPVVNVAAPPDTVSTRDASGMSLPELLVALAVTLVLAAGLARAGLDVRTIFAALPESTDLVQRARAGLAWVADDLARAGAGLQRGENAGPLVQWTAPILPRRVGPLRPDPDLLAFTDRVTVITIPDQAPQARVGDMASAADVVPLGLGVPCPPGDDQCGFAADSHVLAFDATGAFENFVIDGMVPGALISRPTPLSKAFRAIEGARVAGVTLATYYHDTARRQLRRYDGNRSDVPVADDVVSLEFGYLGQPFPPDAPRPPAGTDNCVVDRHGAPRLSSLTATHGTLVLLTPAMLSDGPWCGQEPHRFDADLYRVRQVRVAIRLQAESADLRGRSAVRFRNPGASRAGIEVPDLELTTAVSPRNLRVF